MYIPFPVFSLRDNTEPEMCRYALGGIRFERQADGPRAIATDARHLVVVRWREPSKFENQLVDDFETILPKQDCQLLSRWKPNKSEAKRVPRKQFIHLDEPTCNGTIKLESDDKQMETKSQEGRFPRWKEILPDANPVDRDGKPVVEPYRTTRICPKILMKALKTMASICIDGDENKGVDLSILHNGQVTLTSPDLNTTGYDAVSVIMPLSTDEDLSQSAIQTVRMVKGE